MKTAARRCCVSPEGDKAVLSGLMNGAAEITRRPAIVKTPLDKGEIVMFVTNPIWRNQNIGEYRMLFNALLNYQNLDTPTARHTRRRTGRRHARWRRWTPQPRPAACLNATARQSVTGRYKFCRNFLILRRILNSRRLHGRNSGFDPRRRVSAHRLSPRL